MSQPVVNLSVRVTPRADRNEVTGIRPDGTILVRTQAAPTDGAANAAVVKLLAEALGIRKSDLALTHGHSAREKRFAVTALPDEALERLVKL
ncbi:MAG: DUF167 domain-containing protein [Armatimonas sp.]